MNNHLNDHFQLCAAALCLEEKMSINIAYGEIFYHGNRRREKVNFTLQLRKMTEQAIKQAHELFNAAIPAPIDNSKKCRDCSLKFICMPQEVKKLNRKSMSED
jgi:CRISPR-associated exonuclease Cas4